MKASIIIVTYNSARHLPTCMAALSKQTVSPVNITLVDSGSDNIDFLYPYQNNPLINIIQAPKNCGFCRANNIGIASLPPSDYILLLNPDAFLDHDYLARALAFMEDPLHAACGALTGPLFGYDIEKNVPTGTYDSTGIFCSWYGRWYDRGQGCPIDSSRYQAIDTLPAICGAAFFCRAKALDDVRLPGGHILDEAFYMYKEDIDLSLRLRQQGWKLAFLPSLNAYHCRGWQRERSKMARHVRLISARNECRIQWKQKKPIPLLYSWTKYAAVTLFDL